MNTRKKEKILFGMKFYIASRTAQKEEVRSMYETLKEKGHTLTFDWTSFPLLRPYEEHQNQSRELSVEQIEAIKDADVFLLRTDSAGTDMYIELGVAISSQITYGKPDIYVLGDHNTQSMFYFHPTVKRRKNLDQVLEEIEHK